MIAFKVENVSFSIAEKFASIEEGVEFLSKHLPYKSESELKKIAKDYANTDTTSKKPNKGDKPSK